VCGESIAGLPQAGHLSDDRSATNSVALADITLESRGGRTSADGTPIGPLAVGQSLGRRYHVIKLLGIGGMGAVYQCWDEELAMPIALKVIRPEIVADSEAAEHLERRFKRELTLARKVTHKNVVRIHDLGEIDGVKYITMPYIEGTDLATLMRREGRLPASRTLALMRQIVAGLVAAHEAGVVHRDLKPANIMVTEEDQAYIMDFGIARVAVDATTAVGVVGTVEYMAPEQASGQLVDQRADVYALGLIVSDMLIGRRTAIGDSSIAELMQRMRQAPPSLRTVNPAIPEALDRIVARCTEPDPSARYQTSADLAADLARLDVDGRALTDLTAVAPAVVKPPRTLQRPWVRMALSGMAVGLAVAVFVSGRALWRSTPPVPPSEPVSVAIVPFRNVSGNTALDTFGSSLAEILASDLGHSTYLRTIPSDRLRQVLRDLHLSSDSAFDRDTLRRLGEFSNAQTIVWGQWVKIGNQIQILATLQDLRHTGGATTLKAEASSENALLGAVDHLAAEVRGHLAMSSTMLQQLAAASFKPSSQSFQALRLYNEGLDFVRQGNHPEAVKRFMAATQDDPAFALAYSKLAQSYAALGYDEQAERASRTAIDLSDPLPPHEKYLIEANDARIRHDTSKAIAAYENLAHASPDDPTILFDLGSLYEGAGTLTKARDLFARALQRDPKSVDTLLANGRILIKLQKPDAALDYLNNALSLAIQLENEVAHGNVVQALGIAYRRLDKPGEALRYYRESLEIRRSLGEKSAVAASLDEIGRIQAQMGQVADATASFTQALDLRREIGDRRGIGTVLINLASLYEDRGRSDAALDTYKQALTIERELGDDHLRAQCLNNIGAIYASKGEFEEAVTNLEAALAIREKQNIPGELAETVHNLADAWSKTGQYEKALAEYRRALELERSAGNQRGAAIVSYSLGEIFELQGRYRAAVESKEDALRQFRQLKERSFWMAEILSGYGSALSQAGRMTDATPALDEALQTARNLDNHVLIAQTLNALGDRLYYLGDRGGARAFFDQAVQEASLTSDRRLILGSKINVAKLDVTGTSAQSETALTRLVALGREADGAGLKYLSVECALFHAEGLVARHEYSAARQELGSVLDRSANLGLRTLQAKAYYLLARSLTSPAEAATAHRDYADSARILEDVSRESVDVLKRADLSVVYSESKRAINQS
jgi:serine/threonine protein kinase/tetratricopeptide (TPR) repeat protein